MSGALTKSSLTGAELLQLFGNTVAVEQQTKLSTVKEYVNSGGSAGPVVASSLTITDGLLAENDWINVTATVTGSSSSTVYAPLNFGITDSVNSYGANGVYEMRVQVAPAAGMAGGRTAIFGSVNSQVQNNPGDTSVQHHVGVGSSASSSVNQNGRTGRAVGTGRDGNGSVTSLYGQTILRTGATGYEGIYGAEINSFMQSGASSEIRVGVKASAASSGAVRGEFVDAAFQVGEQTKLGRSAVGWGYGFQVGAAESGFPLDSTSGVFQLAPRLYGTIDIPTIGSGFDLTWATPFGGTGGITAGGFAWASTFASIDDVGGLYGTSVHSSGTIQAETATATGLTIVDPGAYVTFPTWNVSDPPSGGTRITLANNTFKGVGAAAYGNTGNGYVVNDVLTPAGATFVGSITGTTLTVTGSVVGVIYVGLALSGTGIIDPTTTITAFVSGAGGAGTYTVSIAPATATGSIAITATAGLGTLPTWTVSTVSSTRITALTLATNGAWTLVPKGPIRLTGGTGTGAWVEILTTTNAGTFVPVTWEFAATGNGHAVNDTLTVVGDTGTAIQYTVTAVTPDGLGGLFYAFDSSGMQSLALSVAVAGSVTVKAAGTYHTVTSSGSGTGSLIQVLYGVLGLTITQAGVGYPAKPIPRVYTGTTAFKQANIKLTMTAAPARLSLNPAGGQTNINPGTVPANAAASGTAGDMAWDSGFIYLCISTNSWKRVAIAAW